MLARDPKQRPQNIQEIKKHDYFRGISWNQVQEKETVPPWIPDLNKCHIPKHIYDIPLEAAFLERRDALGHKSFDNTNQVVNLTSFKNNLHNRNRYFYQNKLSKRTSFEYDNKLYLEG